MEQVGVLRLGLKPKDAAGMEQRHLRLLLQHNLEQQKNAWRRTMEISNVIRAAHQGKPIDVERMFDQADDPIKRRFTLEEALELQQEQDKMFEQWLELKAQKENKVG